jgi:hypothetical protein
MEKLKDFRTLFTGLPRRHPLVGKDLHRHTHARCTSRTPPGAAGPSLCK